MKLDEVTPVIVTLNEERNIGRVLDRLVWAKQIVVVDGFSADATPRIATSRKEVRFFQRAFDDHASQWNYAVARAGGTEWILTLDADHLVTPQLVEELRGITPDPDVAAFQAPFTYLVSGRPIRGSLYPPRAVLFRRNAVHFVQDGHTQRPVVQGAVASLQNPIEHDDRKSFKDFLRNQDRYMTLEARKIRGSTFRSLPASGKVRKLIVIAPFAAFATALFGRGTILDGWRGVYYALQRMVAEGILSAKLIRSSFKRD